MRRKKNHRLLAALFLVVLVQYRQFGFFVTTFFPLVSVLRTTTLPASNCERSNSVHSQIFHRHACRDTRTTVPDNTPSKDVASDCESRRRDGVCKYMEAFTVALLYNTSQTIRYLPPLALLLGSRCVRTSGIRGHELHNVGRRCITASRATHNNLHRPVEPIEGTAFYAA